MSNLNLRTLATFSTPEEAILVKSVLESRNIASVLEGERMVGLLWHLQNAMGGIKLQVAEADWNAAAAVLAETNHASGPAWQCPKCGADVEATFDLCWQCGCDRSGEGASEPSVAAPTENDDRLTVVSETDDDESEPLKTSLDSVELTVDRAWRAAILGILLPIGIVSAYSLFLLASVMNEELSLKASRRFSVSLVIDGIMLLLAARIVMDVLTVATAI